MTLSSAENLELYHYLVHGLRVRSSVPLSAHGFRDTLTAHDLDVELLAPREIPHLAPEGHTLALYEDDQHGFCCVVQTDGSYTLRFYGLCDFHLTADKRRLLAQLSLNVSEQMASLLLSSTVFSCLLSLAGHCVLHASAVLKEGAVTALIGPSAAGKTSIAAALCSEGYQLVTDDALRCDIGNGIRCHVGTLELRLRAVSSYLANLFLERPQASTIDERFGISPEPAPASSYPLGRLFAPAILPAGSLSVRRLQGSEALTTLFAAARITDFVDPELRRTQFEALAAVCRQLPVYALEVPALVLRDAAGRAKLAELLDSAR